MELFRTSPADRRLLPEGRFSGPMPWVIAIMMFLTVLAAAAGIALARSAQGLGDDLGKRLTVQLSEPSAEVRNVQTAEISRLIARLTVVKSVKPVPEAELSALLDPWLGQDGLDADLPLPALIDIEMKRIEKADIIAVKDIVRGVSAAARVDQSAAWLQPLTNLIDLLVWLSAALVILMSVATAAAVVLAARSALNTHRATLDVLHLLGANDEQIAGLFQRRIALDALFGGLVGLLIALTVMLLIGNRMRAVGSELLGAAGLGWWGWCGLLLLPVGGILLSTLSARLTVLRALRMML